MRFDGHAARALWLGLRALAMLVLLGLAACSTTSRDRNEVGAYPPWLISVAEPAAPAIGMAISQVQWRHGYLDTGSDALDYVRPKIRPLDVFLFSNKGRLSGHTGAGVFGHSAVYLGTERELKSMGLWDDPAIVPHHDAIQRGLSIIESGQAHGTTLTPVSRLVETDRLVVLRPQIGDSGKQAAIVRLFGLVGTRFDHNYRLDESERVFCTELIDLGVPDLRLPRRATYGREIILPDDVALQAVSGKGRLSFVAYLRADRDGWESAGPASLAGDIQGAQSQ